ncbi:MAG: hypothetical protein LAO31_12160 [Acidobacteriia bacterium]|nr:hypothetical protein [Terriglobia bacterium]
MFNPIQAQIDRPMRSADMKGSETRSYTMLIGVLTLLVLLWGNPQAFLIAGVDAWTSNGPEGGWIYALATDPTNPNTVYAGSYGGSVFKSTIGGATWTTVNSGLAYSGISCPVHELLVDPTTPTTLYLGSYGAGVFKSTDGGLSWKASTPPSLDPFITGLVLDPSSPNKIFAVNKSSVLKSTDGGLTWSAKTSGLPSNPWPSDLALDPHSPSNLYVGTNQGVYKSTDAGETWTLANQGITSLNVTALAVDQSASGVVYAAVYVINEGKGYLFKSTDAGANWASASLSTSFVTSITWSQQGVYVASYGGVYMSVTGGPDWNQVCTDFVNTVAVDSAGSIYAATQSLGVMKSTNHGNNWNYMNSNLYGHSITSIAIDTLGTPYAVSRTNGMFKGTGDGNWSHLSNFTQINGTLVAIHPVLPAVLYAGTSDSIYKSTDAGLTWNRSNSGLPAISISVLTIDPATPNVLYLGTTASGLFKSTDGATNWSAANTGLPNNSYIRSVAVDPTNHNIVYLSTNAFALYKSSDGGATWNTMTYSKLYVVITIVIDPTSSSTLYIGGHGGLEKSINSGVSWSKITTGLTDDYMASLVIDPMVPSTLYVGTYGGVFKSTNGGTTWTSMSAGLANLQVNGMVLDPLNPGTIYAATQSGVFVFSSSAGPHAQVALSLPGGGAVSSITGGNGALQHAGYAALTVNSGTDPYGTAVFSFVQNGTVVSEVGVPASPPTRNARFFIDYRTNVPGKSDAENAGVLNINTGFAAVNQGASTATLTLTLRDPNGQALTVGSVTVDPHSHVAKFIDQLGLNLPSGFTTGSLEVASNLPISILALRLTTNQRNETLLTTTPIADLTQPAPVGSLFFPQMADGGGYRTTIMLLNTSSSAVSGKIYFYDDGGLPREVHLTTGPSGSRIPYAIPPGGVYVGVTDGSNPVVGAGSVQVVPDEGSSTPIGSGLFSLTQNGNLVTESGVPSAAPTTHARIYVDTSGGHGTGFAVAAPDTTGFHVTLKAYQLDGVNGAGAGPADLLLASLGHAAKFVGQLISGLPDGFTGVLDISAASPFVALTLRSFTNSRGDFLLTTFPIADMNKPAPAPLIFPQIVDGGGYQTQFILLNSSGAGSSTTLNFYGDNGTPLPVGK